MVTRSITTRALWEVAPDSGGPTTPTLIRGRVLTLRPEYPSADVVLISGGTVAAIGADALTGASDAAVIELGEGEAVVPGFVDSHLHLLSMAATHCSVDADRPDIDGVLGALRDAARGAPERTWIRAVGYDDALLAERRHPSRAEIDEATAGRPTVLHHRTGHAAVLNTEALSAVGASAVGDGLLIDRHDLLSRVPALPEAQLIAALDAVLEELASRGVVAVTDASHTNDLRSLSLLDRPGNVELTAMVGWDRTAGLEYGGAIGRVRVGAAKIMPSGDGVLAAAGTGPAIGDAVEVAHGNGFPAAIHVMEIDTLAESLEALAASPPPAGLRDRIEHCSLALPEQLDAAAGLPLDVVTQPSFVVRRWAKYRDQVSAAEHPWLWPLGSLERRGIPFRLSSDAPVVPPHPAEWLMAATTRQSNPAERISVIEALRACTAGPLDIGSPALLAVVEGLFS